VLFGKSIYLNSPAKSIGIRIPISVALDFALFLLRVTFRYVTYTQRYVYELWRCSVNVLSIGKIRISNVNWEFYVYSYERIIQLNEHEGLQLTAAEIVALNK